MSKLLLYVFVFLLVIVAAELVFFGFISNKKIQQQQIVINDFEQILKQIKSENTKISSTTNISEVRDIILKTIIYGEIYKKPDILSSSVLTNKLNGTIKKITLTNIEYQLVLEGKQGNIALIIISRKKPLTVLQKSKDGKLIETTFSNLKIKDSITIEYSIDIKNNPPSLNSPYVITKNNE